MTEDKEKIIINLTAEERNFINKYLIADEVESCKFDKININIEPRIKGGKWIKTWR